MDKKANSKPMQQILNRLIGFGEFEVFRFGDEVILNAPIEEWPLCDCLLSWHSGGGLRLCRTVGTCWFMWVTKCTV